MRRLRVGIIGQGRSGRDIHDHTIREVVSDRFQVVAVADILADRCERARQEFGYDASTDYRELLRRDDLDLVVNAAPSHLHVPLTIEALEAGHNVLTEKPLARRAADVDRLIAVAEEAGRLLAVYQQSRFAPYFLQVKKVVDSGLLGRIVMVRIAFNGFARRWDWQTLQDMDGGNLLNTGPHPLDQALHFIGREAMPEVFCLMDRAVTFGDAEDHVKLILHREGKPAIDLEISSCFAYPRHTYQVYGTRGGLAGDMKHMDWKYFLPEEAPHQELMRQPIPGPGFCGEKLPWREESWDVPEAEANMMDTMAARFYGNLYEALVHGAPLEVTLPQVRQQIAVIEECHRQNPM